MSREKALTAFETRRVAAVNVRSRFVFSK